MAKRAFMNFIGYVKKNYPAWSEKTKIYIKGDHPLFYNTVGGGILFLMGDFIQQRIEMEDNYKRFDWERFKRMGYIGASVGPPHYYFYRFLDSRFPGRANTTVLKKVLFDAAVTSPSFSIQFFLGLSLMEGKSLKYGWQEFVDKFPTIFLFDCILWPPVQAFNFYLIPPMYRLLYINIVTVGWNVFLSYVKHFEVEPIDLIPIQVLHMIQQKHHDCLDGKKSVCRVRRQRREE